MDDKNTVLGTEKSDITTKNTKSTKEFLNLKIFNPLFSDRINGIDRDYLRAWILNRDGHV